MSEERSEPTLTRAADGTVTPHWPEDAPTTTTVAREVLVQMIDDGNTLRRMRAAIAIAVAELDAEHRPERWSHSGSTYPGCFICYPQHGSWPCVTRLIADDLRKLVEETH